MVGIHTASGNVFRLELFTASLELWLKLYNSAGPEMDGMLRPAA